MHIRSPGAGVCILLTYVWLPFTIFWSRTSMIDYTSVAFALGYLFFFSRWLIDERPADLALTVGAGCLMFLVKLTTSPIVAVAMAYLAWKRLRRDGGPLLSSIVARKSLLAGLTAAAVIPAAVGVAWTEYADGVRAASPATAWLAASLESWNTWNAWNFGTWEQRAAWNQWTIFQRLEGTFLPLGYMIFPLIGLWRAIRIPSAGGAFVLTMALGALATVAIFFNLFVVHNYYLMAISPAIAIATGFGLHRVCFELLPRERMGWIVALLLLAFSQWNARAYLAPAFGADFAAARSRHPTRRACRCRRERLVARLPVLCRAEGTDVARKRPRDASGVDREVPRVRPLHDTRLRQPPAAAARFWTSSCARSAR